MKFLMYLHGIAMFVAIVDLIVNRRLFSQGEYSKLFIRIAILMTLVFLIPYIWY